MNIRSQTNQKPFPAQEIRAAPNISVFWTPTSNRPAKFGNVSWNICMGTLQYIYLFPRYSNIPITKLSVFSGRTSAFIQHSKRNWVHAFCAAMLSIQSEIMFFFSLFSLSSQTPKSSFVFPFSDLLRSCFSHCGFSAAFVLHNADSTAMVLLVAECHHLQRPVAIIIIIPITTSSNSIDVAAATMVAVDIR